MKKITLLLFAVLIASVAFFTPVEAKTVKVKGYFKPSTGKYVMPSYKTSPNKTKLDNWSTKGNYNPYTGKKGYAKPYKW